MADCQITCITKPHPLSAHEHIIAVGNPSVPWKLAVADVIGTSIAKLTRSSSSTLAHVLAPMSV